MAEKYGMKVVEKETFAEYFSKMIDTGDGRGLIGRMQSLEVNYVNGLLIQDTITVQMCLWCKGLFRSVTFHNTVV